MLAILDYEAGNQTSVSRALTSLDVPNSITADAKTLLAADGVIFPGVGAAGQAMDLLRSRGLDAVLNRIVEKNIPLLGICLGCQIMLEHSEESDTATLGIFKGKTRRFAEDLTDETGERIRIPHMGWNSAPRQRDSRLFDGIPQDAEFYFVHSYYVEPEPEAVLAMTDYGKTFCSAIGRDGLWAVQFHAEKSGRYGLRLLRNYYEYCREVAHAQ
ncbi:Imidazole glycerol phosphate synthase subunit HisH [uncultured delta proteobacterium]|uniref:Imidazole glycerol phosphate synthase subunit HisH n=1 Tax=uncultured delta proteobacterium TaxID=34034 RepID=A0A212JUZ8_9DELT|nr:Imidazole glycerol phosphate synthase subunit HisH [uncultured delta proteobacterium]